MSDDKTGVFPMSGQTTNSAGEIVFTARRRWSHEEKRALLAELTASGLTVSEFSRRCGVSRDLVFRWRREARERPAPTGFIPLSLPAPRTADRSAGIEIILASGVRLVIGDCCDLALLRRVVDLLERRPVGHSPQGDGG